MHFSIFHIFHIFPLYIPFRGPIYGCLIFSIQRVVVVLASYIWLRLFCSALFRACPGQLLVYAICKEGSPKNRGEKVTLVSPAMEKEVRKKSEILKTNSFFHNFNMGGTYSTTGKRSLYDQGVPERVRWVQEAGNMFLAQVRLLRIGPKLG